MAIIEEPNLLSVESNQVPNPKFIAYGWSMDPLCTLDNSADLPTSPFKIELDSKKTYSAVDDSFIEKGNQSNTNYGASLELQVKKGLNETDVEKVAYLKFDIRNLAFTNIDNAQIRLFVNAKENNTMITAHKTSSDWEENDIIFNNAPEIDEQIASEIITEAGIFYDFDIQEELENALENENFFFSVALMNTSNETIVFASSESNTNRPALILNAATTLSTENLDTPMSFYLFPNPVKSGIINIHSQLPLDSSKTKIHLTNLLGQTFEMSSRIWRDNYRLNIGHLSSGTYILTIEYEGVRYHKNLIVIE